MSSVKPPVSAGEVSSVTVCSGSGSSTSSSVGHGLSKPPQMLVYATYVGPTVNVNVVPATGTQVKTGVVVTTVWFAGSVRFLVTVSYSVTMASIIVPSMYVIVLFITVTVTSTGFQVVKTISSGVMVSGL